MNVQLYIMIDSSHEKLWGEVHEIATNFILPLVIVHVLGVAFERVINGENLIKAI